MGNASTSALLKDAGSVEGKSGGCTGPTTPVPYRNLGFRSDTSSKGCISASHTTDQLVAASSTREKKKKMTGFATLRRKLIRRRRTSKSYDHGKIIREFVADWSPLELNALVEEYEATAALKDLSVQADLARPPASTFKQDLSDLFDYKYASDVTLIFQGACFPAHRAILSARCGYFRDLLTGSRPGAHVHVDSLLHSRGIDVPTFASLLRYLYTGDFSLHDGDGVSNSDVGTNLEVLIRLGQEFGTPNALEHDLRYLMETGDLADAVLVFAAGQDFQASAAVQNPQGGSTNNGSSQSSSSSSDYGFFPWLEIPCHRSILSARSPFFRNLIQRRCRPQAADATPPSSPTRIVLDETVIPRRYARVLMQALYLDTVDMNCIVRATTVTPDPESASHTSTAHTAASVSAPAPSLFDEATELYQIGRFLELDILSQGCEDVLVDNLCLDNLPAVLRWSELPYGSPWVRRQALQLLREEFSAMAQAPIFLELDKLHLIDALQSDFLQASELEVLSAVLRWGEHQLVRRMEDREPNVVSQTAHSVARKGVRRRDLNDVELRDILSELLPHVRVDHVLPPNHETLTGAIRRGLVSTPPSHMIGGDVAKVMERGEQLRIHAWIRGKPCNGLYVKPRLFMPYFEEAKSLLADQLVQEMELVRLRMVRMSSHIPDALYMIDNTPSPALTSSFNNCIRSSSGVSSAHDSASSQRTSATSDLDVVTGAVPVPDSETLQAMIRRERKLRLSPLCQRAYSLPLASRRDINRQIRLRVVREFNLPDSIAEVLESAAYQFAEEADESEQTAAGSQAQGQVQSAASVWEPRKLSSMACRIPIPPKRMTSRKQPQSLQLMQHAGSLSALDMPDLDDALDDPALLHLHRMHHQSQLSEFIPDIALATATAALSVNGQLSLPHFVAPLQPPEPYRELQLDLGDGVGSGRISSEWSVVRPNAHTLHGAGNAAAGSHPIRLSTFRSAEENADPWPLRTESSQESPNLTRTATHSPRSQRRSRSSRAADVRVFI